MGAHPALVGVLAAAGDIALAVVSFFIAQRVAAWWEKRRNPEKVPARERWSGSAWRRWGEAGLGFTAPVLAGVLITTALGVVLKVHRARLLLWMCVGVVFWTALLVLAGVLGLSWFESLRG